MRQEAPLRPHRAPRSISRVNLACRPVGKAKMICPVASKFAPCGASPGNTKKREHGNAEPCTPPLQSIIHSYNGCLGCHQNTAVPCIHWLGSRSKKRLLQLTTDAKGSWSKKSTQGRQAARLHLAIGTNPRLSTLCTVCAHAQYAIIQGRKGYEATQDPKQPQNLHMEIHRPSPATCEGNKTTTVTQPHEPLARLWGPSSADPSTVTVTTHHATKTALRPEWGSIARRQRQGSVIPAYAPPKLCIHVPRHGP